MQSLFPTAPSSLTDDDLAGLYAYPVERTWVRANFVSTVDGAVQGSDGRSGSLSTPADRRLFGLLRSLCDVVLVGAATVRAEGYLPVQAHEIDGGLRQRLGLAPVPAIAVVTRSGNLPESLLTNDGGPVEVFGGDGADVSLRQVVEQLARAGYQRVLCEGGPHLLHDLLAEGCCDELCLTVASTVRSGAALRMCAGPMLEPAVELRLQHVLEEDGTLFCRYTRMRG